MPSDGLSRTREHARFNEVSDAHVGVFINEGIDKVNYIQKIEEILLNKVGFRPVWLPHPILLTIRTKERVYFAMTSLFNITTSEI